jgi:hypothetical protein
MLKQQAEKAAKGHEKQRPPKIGDLEWKKQQIEKARDDRGRASMSLNQPIDKKLGAGQSVPCNRTPRGC